MEAPAATAVEIWTVGHSTRPFEEFFLILSSFRIQAVADVRRFPMSRRYPHFSQPVLGPLLEARGISYHHFAELGGRRSPRPDSHNTAWRSAQFRGYADYMESPGFREAIDRRLLPLAGAGRTALMCAEAVWWKCHRSLLADYLKAKGISVHHILGEGKSQEHPYTPAATVSGGTLSYRRNDPDLFG